MRLGRSPVHFHWSADAFSPKNLLAFRALHPEGRNFLVVPFAPEAFKRRFGVCEVTVCTPSQRAALRDDVAASD